MSKAIWDCPGFALLCSVTGQENLDHSPNHSDEELKASATWSPAFWMVNVFFTSSSGYLYFPFFLLIKIIPFCLQWNLDFTKCQGTGEIGLLYWGSVAYIIFTVILATETEVLFILLRTLLSRGLSNWGSTVLTKLKYLHPLLTPLPKKKFTVTKVAS